MFVKPLSDSHRPGDFTDCTGDRGFPVLDTLLSLTNVASAFYVADEEQATNKSTAVVVGLLAGAGWLFSATYGYSKTGACAAAKKEAEGPMRRLRFAPVSYPYPQGPRPGTPAAAVAPAPPAGTVRATPAPAPRQDDDEPSVRLSPEHAPAPDGPR
jgi:hypothetical protein